MLRAKFKSATETSAYASRTKDHSSVDGGAPSAAAAFREHAENRADRMKSNTSSTGSTGKTFYPAEKVRHWHSFLANYFLKSKFY